ncbi:MAG: hypothetical protein P4L99_05255 [Chthoniobacter sp.]|nr:hypothetical protein [Chthoniobacter sp.]
MPLPDEYEFDRDQSPTAFVQVGFTTPGDRDRFLRVLWDFAARHALASQPGPFLPDDRQIPGPFTNRNLLLAPLIADTFPDSKMHYAQARLELRRRSFPRDQFRDIVTDFISALRTEFGAQVRMAGSS